jgi:hypothetical protein
MFNRKNDLVFIIGKSANACKQTPVAKAVACFLLILQTEG